MNPTFIRYEFQLPSGKIRVLQSEEFIRLQTEHPFATIDGPRIHQAGQLEYHSSDKVVEINRFSDIPAIIARSGGDAILFIQEHWLEYLRLIVAYFDIGSLIDNEKTFKFAEEETGHEIKSLLPKFEGGVISAATYFGTLTMDCVRLYSLVYNTANHDIKIFTLFGEGSDCSSLDSSLPKP